MQLLIIIMARLKTLSLVWKIRESRRSGSPSNFLSWVLRVTVWSKPTKKIGSARKAGYRVYQRYLKTWSRVSIGISASRVTYYYFLVSLRILRLLHEMFTWQKLRSWMNEESRKLLAVDYDQISGVVFENTELIIECLETSRGFTRVLSD